MPQFILREGRSYFKGVFNACEFTPDGDADQLNKLQRVKDWKTAIAVDRGATISDGESSKLYGVRGFPTVVVIDREGRVAFNSSLEPGDVTKFMEDMRQLAGVDLRQGLLDLELRFSTGHALQIIPVSAGYEANDARLSTDAARLPGGDSRLLSRYLPAQIDPFFPPLARLRRASGEKNGAGYTRRRFLDCKRETPAGKPRASFRRVNYTVISLNLASLGYEAWEAFSENLNFIAVGGGELTIFGGGAGGG